MKASIAAIKSIRIQEDMMERLTRIENKLDEILKLSGNNDKAGKEEKKAASTKKLVEEVKLK